jgi:hypothetical protein
MADFTKLATFLDSFDKSDKRYDLVSFIKTKIAQDMRDRETINNGEEAELEDNDITMATPDQQSGENTEGKLMDGAFKEFDVQNKLDDEKKEVKLPDSKEQGKTTTLNSASPSDFTGTSLTHTSTQTKKATLFDVLQKRLKK